ALWGAGSCRSPHLPRGLHDDFQLSFLIVFTDEIANHVRGKATLGADRELFQGNILACRLDPTLEVVDLFDFRYLGAHQSQNNDLALRDKAQRLEGPGARAVVFEQQPVVTQFVEKSFSDRVIASLPVPHAALIAAAQVNA